MSNVWWVNQGDTARQGHFEIIWAPKHSNRQRSDGSFSTPRHWSSLLSAVKGDFVIHAANQHIGAISRVLGNAVEEKKPSHFKGPWDTVGYRLPTETIKLDQPIPFSLLGANFLRKFTEPGEPFSVKEGKIATPKQGYFFSVPAELASAIFNILGISSEIDSSTNEKINFVGNSDAEVTTKIRREQPQLRSLLLKGRVEAPCSLCEKTFPSQYLVASHIKRRADCTEDERRDSNIVMLTCLFGCDKAFEEGDLYVDDKGMLQVSDHAHREVRAYLGSLTDKEVSIYNTENEDYFSARRKQHGNM